MNSLANFLTVCLAINKVTDVIRTGGGYIGYLRARVSTLHPEIGMAMVCRDCLSGYTSLFGTMALAKIQPNLVNPFNFVGFWLAVWGGVRAIYRLNDYRLVNLLQSQRPASQVIDTFNRPGEIPLHLGQRVHLVKDTLATQKDKQLTIKVSDVATISSMLIKQCDCQDKRRYILDYGGFLYEAGRSQIVAEENYA